MKSPLNPKNSLSALKSISSLAAVKNPSISPTQNPKPPKSQSFRPLSLPQSLHKINPMHYSKYPHLTCPLPQNQFTANPSLHCEFFTRLLLQIFFSERCTPLFDESPKRNVISWNFMVSGYNRNSMYGSSWGVFCRMHCLGFEPDEFTYGSVLSACAALGAPGLGEQVYCLAGKSGYFCSYYVRSGMIDLLAKCGGFEDALRVFRDGSCRNVVVWNGVISGAVRNGEHRGALELFREMCCGVLLPNKFTFSSVLTACGALGEIGIGREVQGWVIKRGAEDVFVGTAVVDLYAKCGKMNEAVKVFSRLPTRNVVSWTAIISAFVGKDDSISALKFFREMRRIGEEIKKFTVTSVFTACAKHTMIKEAMQIHSLVLKAGFDSAAVIRAALINVYSKIGAVDFSEVVFREMETVKDPGAWAAMVSSYAQNQNPERAVGVFRRMLQESVKPDKFSTSSVLSI